MKTPRDPAASLFDGADVVGIGWGTHPKDRALDVDPAALRQFADRCEAEADAALCRSAADEIEAMRAQLVAYKKATDTQAKQLAAWRRAGAKDAP